jgi:nucleotide-binding universal stress UspA family protein
MRGRILLAATDLGPRGDDAIVEGLTQLAADSGSCLHVFHVFDPHKLAAGLSGPLLAHEEQILAGLPAALGRRIQYDAVLNGVLHNPKRVRSHVRLGPPVETLLEACVDYKADLLIVGAHGQHGSARLLLGSVAEQLLREAPCPTLVARPRNYHGLTKSAFATDDHTPVTTRPPGARSR